MSSYSLIHLCGSKDSKKEAKTKERKKNKKLKGFTDKKHLKPSKARDSRLKKCRVLLGYGLRARG